MTAPRRVVLTGGPSSGKTTLIDLLEQEGRRVCPESGRRVILEEIARGGDALPWADRSRFAERMLDEDIRAYDAAGGEDIFFDRRIPDVLGYLRLYGLPQPERLREAVAARRYADPVFLAPFWP